MVFKKTILSAQDDYASIAKPKSSSSRIARGTVLAIEQDSNTKSAMLKRETGREGEGEIEIDLIERL